MYLWSYQYVSFYSLNKLEKTSSKMMASPIPKLQPGQKVGDWPRLYIAGTALVTEKQ